MPADTRLKHRVKPATGAPRWAVLTYGAMIALVVLALIVFRAILLPFIFALIVVYVLEPLVSWTERRLRLPRWVAVLGCYLALALMLVGGGAYLAPKLRTESVKVAEKFRSVAEGLPATMNRLGQGLAQLIDRLEGKNTESSAAIAADARADRDTGEWGYGPDVPAIPLVEPKDVPALTQATIEAEDRALVQGDEEARGRAALKRSAEEVDADKRRANVVLNRISEGVYGIQLNPSTVQFEDVGDGTYNVIPHAERHEEDTGQNVKNRLMKSLRGALEGVAGRVVGEVVNLIRDIVGIASRALVALVVLLMVAGFVLVDYRGLAAWWRSRVPVRYRSDYDELLHRLDAGLSGVVRGQLLICLINGVLSGIGFAIFIPEYAVTFAILAGTMSLIPIFGTILSTVPAVLIGLTISFGTAAAVLLWVLIIHAIEANFLNPKIIASQAKLPPVAIVFALIAGESAFGITGALLAVPTLSIMHSIMGFLFVRVRRHVIGPEPELQPRSE